jgi:hypothetical protein
MSAAMPLKPKRAATRAMRKKARAKDQHGRTSCVPPLGISQRIKARRDSTARRKGWRCTKRKAVMRSSRAVISWSRGVFMRSP